MRGLGRYRRLSVRLSTRLAVRIGQLALRDGWELSDLARALVILAATGAWLGLRKEENVARLTEHVGLNRASIALKRAIHGSGSKRPYAPRGSAETSVFTLILPVNFSALIELYANAIGCSKNDLCRSLLTKGLIVYLRGQKAVIQALRGIAGHPEA
jgi:hypothetical protein